MNEEKPFSGPQATHESYGLLQFSRISGGGEFLFGSAVKHQNPIALRIRRAGVIRELNQDWYSEKETLIEVRVSHAQFAEAITSMNMGQGVPCTITRVGDTNMADCPQVSEREVINSEFEKTMRGVAKKFKVGIDAAKELLEKKSLTKGDRAAIVASMEDILRKLGDTVPFIHEQFNEATEKTLTQAKGEIEAFYIHAVTAAGQQALSAASPKRQELEGPGQ